MDVIALANLGTHDLKDAGGKYPLPEFCTELLNAPERWTEYRLPIIVPFLKGVQEKTKRKPVLILFVTWQEGVKGSLHSKDTERLGQLIKLWLEPNGRSEYQGLAERVILSPPVRSEPHNHDLMLKWFEETLPDCIRHATGRSSCSITDPPRLHISVTAGTPAMNIALLFKSFGLRIGRVENVWHVDENSERAIVLRTGHVLAGEPLRRTFEAHLDRFDYEAAAELSKYITDRWVQIALQAFADIRRSDFDRVLNRIPKKKQWEDLRSWLTRLSDGRKELYAAVDTTVKISDGVRAVHAYQIAEMRMQFHRKDYPEALTALYRLQESLLRIAFEQVTGLPGEISQSKSREKEWSEQLDSFLSSHSGQIDENLKCERHIHRTVLRRIAPDHPVTLWEERLYSSSGKRSLGDLRNKSRVAHGFCEVTDKAIKAAGWPGGAEEIVESATVAAESLLGELPAPPNPKWHSAIIRHARESDFL